MRTNLILILGAVFWVAIMVACGSSEPKTYEDCVLKAMEGGGKSDRAASIIARACREKFPLPVVEEPESPKFPEGSYYYRSGGATCLEISVYSDGSLSLYKSGFCDANSRFEYPPGSGLTFTCLDFNKSGVARVFDVEWRDDGLQLSKEGTGGMLYNTLAACERSITDEQRDAAEKRKQEKG